MRSVSFQPGLPSASRRGARFGDDVRGHAGELGVVFAVVAPRVGRVEQVLLEARRELAQLLVHGLEARLVGVVELGAAELEVAQLVVDQLALRGVEARERRARRAARGTSRTGAGPARGRV